MKLLFVNFKHKFWIFIKLALELQPNKEENRFRSTLEAVIRARFFYYYFYKMEKNIDKRNLKIRPKF
jgi:hypothetical protein